MATKTEKSIVLPIKGREWKFVLMTDRAFDKLYNNNENAADNENAAMTRPTLYEVHFRRGDWDLITIRHELGHVFFSMSLTNSSSLDPAQTEETFCEVIAHHGSEIILLSDRIAERFFQE